MNTGQKPNKLRCSLLFGIAMVDELAVTNEIWQKWIGRKILPPMTWAELRKKVEEFVKAGKDPYDILRGPAPAKEWMEKKGFAEVTPSQIDNTISDIQRYIDDEKKVERLYYMESQNPVIKAINASNIFLEISKEEKIHAQELEALLPKLKEKWMEEVKLRENAGNPEPPGKLKELFAGRTLEGYVEAAKVRTLETFKGVTFYFETTAERDKAREFLGRHNFYFPDGPEISLKDIDNPDYMLELLAYEGFDTSKIQVER
jgi:rubrerythrin